MTRTRALVRIIDNFTEVTGRALSWLCLALAVMTSAIVLLRYGFDIGWVAAQESITYLHASLFMLGAAYTLKHGGHVRVDIFYRRFSQRTCAWINSIGAIVFLLPLCLFITFISWQFVSESWAIREGSMDPGGIQGVFLLKSLIPLMAVNLMLQGMAELLRNAAFLVEDS